MPPARQLPDRGHLQLATLATEPSCGPVRAERGRVVRTPHQRRRPDRRAQYEGARREGLAEAWRFREWRTVAGTTGRDRSARTDTPRIRRQPLLG